MNSVFIELIEGAWINVSCIAVIDGDHDRSCIRLIDGGLWGTEEPVDNLRRRVSRALGVSRET